MEATERNSNPAHQSNRCEASGPALCHRQVSCVDRHSLWCLSRRSAPADLVKGGSGRLTFIAGVRSSLSTAVILTGTWCRGRVLRTRSVSSASDGVGVPGAVSNAANGTSPNRSSYTPTTQASITAGCEIRTRRMVSGRILKPPWLIAPSSLPCKVMNQSELTTGTIDPGVTPARCWANGETGTSYTALGIVQRASVEVIPYGVLYR